MLSRFPRACFGPNRGANLHVGAIGLSAALSPKALVCTGLIAMHEVRIGTLVCSRGVESFFEWLTT